MSDLDPFEIERALRDPDEVERLRAHVKGLEMTLAEERRDRRLVVEADDFRCRDLEARCARLEEALEKIADDGLQGAAIARVALSDTAQQEMVERLVTVCDHCFRASCWQGKFHCEKSITAGTTQKTIAELERLALEHPSHWQDKNDE